MNSSFSKASSFTICLALLLLTLPYLHIRFTSPSELSRIPKPSPYLSTDSSFALHWYPTATVLIGSSEEERQEALQSCTKEAWNQQCSMDQFSDELKRRSIVVSGFWLEDAEISLLDYMRCVHAGICTYRVQGATAAKLSENYPVENLRSSDVALACAFKGRRQLFTEEFEYAAGGPNANAFPWGNRYLSGLSNHGKAAMIPTDSSDGFQFIAPSHSYSGPLPRRHASDLSANVAEWVVDKKDKSNWLYGGSYLEPLYASRSHSRVRSPRSYLGAGGRCAISNHAPTIDFRLALLP